MYTYSYTFPYGWAVFKISADGDQEYVCSFMTAEECRDFCNFHNKG